MKKEVNDKFLYFVDILNKENNKLHLKIIFNENSIDSILDEYMFFKSGYIIMLLYIFNGNFNGKVKYNNGVFYTRNLAIDQHVLYDTKVKNVIDDIINKSIYNKRFLPSSVSNITYENLKSIEIGFTDAYKFFIKEKLDIIAHLDINKDVNLINMLKILNYNDLNMQLQFLRLKFGYLYKKDFLLEKLKKYEECNINFINESCEYLNHLIERSIIGMNKKKLEMMWIQHDQGKLVTTKYNNIYIAIYLKFISTLKNNKYYLESAKQLINPLLDDKEIIESELSLELFKILYLNSKSINHDSLNSYLIRNEQYADMMSNDDIKRFTLDTNKKAMDFIKNETMNVLDKIIT